MGLFDQARECINASIVEHFTQSPGAYWKDGEYWTRNPARGDDGIGSFSISEKGLWHDFATNESGDLISLIIEIQGGTKKAAAEEIIRRAGAVISDDGQPKPQGKKKWDKPLPQIPIPENLLKGLNDLISSPWYEENHGKPVKGWVYRNADGNAVFCVARFRKKDGSKDVLPFYFGQDSKWHGGQALKSSRPLYKLDQVIKADRATPVLVVEGEKCASIDVPGYIVTTWSGGCSAVTKTDWAPLEGRDVLIWPDADAPGIKAAGAIATRLPDARILQITGKPKGWDIADAVSDGVDPVAFIAEQISKAVRLPDNKAQASGAPFICLGYDDSRHWFMRRDMRLPFAIQMGAFTQSKLLELAELSFWTLSGHTTDQQSIRVSTAQDDVGAMSRTEGRFEPDKLRGAGVWRDHDGLLVNDGKQIIHADGSVSEFDKYRSPFHYVSSSTTFSNLAGAEATTGDGKELETLFHAQGFSRPYQSVLAMGWALIAPFGGILRWRPHIWITGKKGSGKSWVLNDLIQPLCGPFAHKGSGKDSEAGIRRSLNMDARPVILDEMEPKGQKGAEKIASILDLARNASSDGSGYITIAAYDGGVQRFVVRSCFCFGSIQTPDEGAAIASRVSRLELKAPASQAEKFKKSAELYASAMQDPSRYTRRIFRSLPRIISDVEWIRSAYLHVFGEQRKVDQVAPLLAAAWAVQSDETLEKSAEGQAWLARYIGDLQAPEDGMIEDEEAVVDHLLSAHVRVDGGEIRTVGELLSLGFIGENLNRQYQDLLARYGIKVFSGGLAISSKSDQIRSLLRDTPYSTGYGAQIRRHRFCLDDKTRQVRMAGQARAQCYVLDWHKFREEYIDGNGRAIQGEFTDDVPF